MVKQFLSRFSFFRKYITFSSLILALLVILAGYICFYKIGTAYLDDWDEAWYGEMTRQMLKSGNLIVLSWNGTFLYDKPPLSIWLTSISSLIFGLSEFSVRLPQALSGFITICIILYISFKNWGLVPAIIGYLSLILNNIYIWRVRSGNLDSVITLLFLLIFLTIQMKSKWKYAILGFLFTLTFLGKTSLVYFPITIFVIYEILYNTRSIIKNFPQYLLGAAIFLFIICGWFILGYKMAGIEFVKYYLFQSDQGVSNISLDKFKTEYIGYAYYSLQRRFFFVMLLGALASFVYKWRQGKYFLIIAFSFGLLALLSFTERNNNWYLTPSIPFWALLVTYGTSVFIRSIKKLEIPLSIIVLSLSFYISYKTYTGHIVPLIHTSSSYKHAQTAIKSKSLSTPYETIVRMDHLYSSTIYYSERKVLSSPSSSNDSNLFISRDTLALRLGNGSIRLLLGQKGDIESFVKQYGIQGKYVKVNDEEEIFIATRNKEI